GLRQGDNEEMFLALAAAVRLRQDSRFLDDLLAVLTANRPRLRQVVAETLAALPDPNLVRRLTVVAKDARLDIRVRQTALWTLGRCGRKEAAAELVEQLDATNEDVRRVAASALGELTGQSHGSDRQRWKTWWTQNKNMTSEQWLHMRLGYQTSRAQRLEGEVMRARAREMRRQQFLDDRRR